MTLSGANLSGANLCGADLSGANLINIDLSGANLCGANLSGARLKNANLYGAYLSDSRYADEEIDGDYLLLTNYANLSKADLRGTVLNYANLLGIDFTSTLIERTHFSGSHLVRANLSGINLSSAYFIEANLSHANLSRADLSGAKLSGANLSHANLSRANLRGANLSEAKLSYVNLREADLSEADLSATYFKLTALYNTNFKQATFGRTSVDRCSLRTVQGLETVKHSEPSSIGIDTIYLSGAISESFLRGAGVPHPFIENMQALVEAISSIDFYSCFISYTSKDQIFAERLYVDLQSKGVRCWFASEDLKIGDHYHQRIDESIHLYEKLILILSEHAVESAWVEREVVAAREKEDREQLPVLFPLRLDDAVMSTTKAWAADVRRRWHIGDFTRWKDDDAYQQAFEYLLRDLKAGQKPKV